jgi:hypothetical protein
MKAIVQDRYGSPSVDLSLVAQELGRAQGTTVIAVAP